MAHNVVKTAAPGHPKRKPARKGPHSESREPKQTMHTQGEQEPQRRTTVQQK